MKLYQILLINTILTALVIGNAFVLKKQYYPAVVYITKSKPSIAIIGVQVILFLTLYVKGLSKIFFGEISSAEHEYLSEHLWPALYDSCFAFAIFYKNINSLFYFRLFCLFFFKGMHFMTQLRINSMALVVRLPQLFHIRIIGLLLYLGFIDVYQISISLSRTRSSGLSLEVLYVFEYSKLLLSVIQYSFQYMLEYIDGLNGENIWDEKIVYSNYLDLIFVVSKCVLHFLFIGIFLKMRILPIFLIHSVVRNIRNLKTCYLKTVMSRRAIARMERFPHPRQEDLSEDNMCAICRDEIKSVESAKKLFCKHIFHIQCLRDWLRRQQKCPTCRSDVINAVEPVDQMQANGQQPEEVQNEDNN